MLWKYSINGNLPSYRAQLAHQTPGLAVSKEVRCLPLVSLTVELSPGGGWGWWRELIFGHLGTFFPSEWYKNHGCVVRSEQDGAGAGGQTRGLHREERGEASIS